jgi:hypothetical protein
MHAFQCCTVLLHPADLCVLTVATLEQEHFQIKQDPTKVCNDTQRAPNVLLLSSPLSSLSAFTVTPPTS